MALVGAIDIGTNTVLLVVGERDSSGAFRISEDCSEVSRLGEGVDREGLLSERSMARTSAAVEQFVQRARSLGATRIKAVATAAVRIAQNGADFAARLAAVCGAPIEVVDSDREADLVARSVIGDPALPVGPKVVIDVGGGSTELIRIVGDEVVERVSLGIGSVRLTERILDAEIPSDAALAKLRAVVSEALESLSHAFSVGPFAVVGVAGTVTTLAAVALGLATYDPARVHGCRLGIAAVEEQLARYRTMTVAARQRVPGMASARADVILAGATIVARAVRWLGRGTMWVSDRGVRYGLLAELAAGEC